MEASQRLVKRFAGAVERSTSYSSTQECTTKAMGSCDPIWGACGCILVAPSGQAV